MSNTFERFKGLIVDILGVDESVVTKDADMIADFGMDSIDSVTVLMAVEDEFLIELDDDEADKVITVSDAVDLIDRVRAAA